MDRDERAPQAPSEDERPQESARPAYEPPRIVAYDESALLDLVGPAVACARWL